MGSQPVRRSGTARVPEAVRAGRSLARLSRMLEQASSAAGLTLAQYRVLVFVADRPQRASALAAKVDVQRATLSAIVAGLDKLGLLRRVGVAGDGRGVQLELTAEGRRSLDRVDRALGQRLAEVADAGAVGVAGLAADLQGMLQGYEAVQDRARAGDDQPPRNGDGATARARNGDGQPDRDRDGGGDRDRPGRRRG